MPIYEYKCRSCGHSFEELVFGDPLPECPKCHSEETEKLISRCSCRLGGSSSAIDSAPAAPSGGGCSGCAGGNCASCCGH